MKLTNKFELPETFINAIQRPQYDKGDSQISATEILNSPRIVQLKRKHWDELEQDAADMVWSLFGSAVHEILQHGKSEHHIVEQRIFTEFHGWKISGAIDLQEVYEDGIIVSDYKVTGAWAVMNEKQDWHNQLNVYAWLIENGNEWNILAAYVAQRRLGGLPVHRRLAVTRLGLPAHLTRPDGVPDRSPDHAQRPERRDGPGRNGGWEVRTSLPVRTLDP